MNDVSPAHAAWTPDGETKPKPTEDAIIAAIAEVYDPEIPVNIYELGLIYAIDIADDGAVKIEMTLTAPACPSAQELPEQYTAPPCRWPALPRVTWRLCGSRPGTRAG